MRIKNLSKIYIYEPKRVLESGERITTWYYKGEEWINVQQDIDELTQNSAGQIDYEVVKLRIDKKINLIKGDGVSSSPLPIDDKKKVVNNGLPSYVVENEPKIGNTTLYTLSTNNRE